MPVIERVSPEEAVTRIQDVLGAAVANVHVNHGTVAITCERAELVNVVRTLRDGEGLQCRFFSFLSAVDRSEFNDKPEDMPDLELLVHLYSPDHAFSVTVHVPLDLANPECPSITSVFKGALWHEREAFDLFGIRFDGHPNLVRLYLPEDFEGHPMLRSFKLATRGAVKEWPGAKDPEEAAAGGR